MPDFIVKVTRQLVPHSYQGKVTTKEAPGTAVEMFLEDRTRQQMAGKMVAYFHASGSADCPMLGTLAATPDAPW